MCKDRDVIVTFEPNESSIVGMFYSHILRRNRLKLLKYRNADDVTAFSIYLMNEMRWILIIFLFCISYTKEIV